MGRTSVENKTIQTGINQVTKKFEDVELFKGIIKLDDENIAQFDPFRTGYATFFWTKMPPFMEVGQPAMCERFKNLTEKGHTSFDGIDDLSADTDDMTGGMAGTNVKILTGIKESFDTFTMKVYELQGSPIREAVEYWLTGIFDPKSGYAHYHGQLNQVPGGYCAKNHTAELIYIVTDPTGMNVEYAAYICNIVPTKVTRSHMNITHGEHGIAALDLEFTGIKYESVGINQMAKRILEKNRNIESYIGFVPNKSTQTTV